jgi:NAD(P)-dependent dehydrogenase (short-subunit alcohol dehydrogenase family)
MDREGQDVGDCAGFRVTNTVPPPQALLDHNAKVYVAGRDEKKGIEAMQWLKTETGKEAHFLKLDLADLKAVKASAEQYMRRVHVRDCATFLPADDIDNSLEKELHLLFNNA